MYREKPTQDSGTAQATAPGTTPPTRRRRQPRAKLVATIARILGASRARAAQSPPPAEPGVEWMMRMMG